MLNYPQLSNEVSISEEFPIISSKISTMTKQTKKDLSHFDNIRYDNNSFLIDLVRREQRRRSTIKSTLLLNQQDLFPIFKSPVKYNQSNAKMLISKLTKRKPNITLSPLKFNSNIVASPEKPIHFRNIKNTLFSNYNTTFSNDELKKTNSIPLSTQQKVFSSCEEIEGNCFTIKEKCVKKNKRNYLGNFIKKANQIKKRSQLEELKNLKKQVGTNSVMNIQIKNKRVIDESNCIQRMDNNLAFKANKTINNIFFLHEKPTYFTNSSYRHFNDIKLKRKKQIKELKDLMYDNQKEHFKFSQTYNNYINK